MPQIKACLFDMDGLLIDSERIYTETTQRLLQNHGKSPIFPMSIKSQMMGRPHPQSSEIFLAWSGIDITPDEYHKEQRALQLSRFPHVQVMPGARSLVSHLKRAGVPIGLATSSTAQNFALKSTNLKDFFGDFDAVITGDDERVVGKGKPAPDIFLHCLSELNQVRAREGLDEIKCEECLVLEDGVPGVQAGLAAGMHVLWVPDDEILAIHRDQVEEILGQSGKMVNSLEDFDWAYYGFEGIP